mmetsp:Transcript_10644/g.28179  ORF Transcript_10644/g.28179 Transcript_10644/m.28179 type:complete len:224 (-) Transcript_10644:488-1159(-)
MTSRRAKAGTADRPAARILEEMTPASHCTTPVLFSMALMLTRIANHVMVVQAPDSPAQSPHVRVPVNRSAESPSTAVVTGFTPMTLAPAHMNSMPRMVEPKMISSLDIGPISSSFLLASLGASGVSLTSGGSTLYTRRGVRTMAVSAGTQVALSHAMNGLLMTYPACAASFRARRFCAAPNSQSEEEFPVAWKADCTRNAPVFLSVPSAGSEPLAWATERTKG